jgi:DNA-binding MarR family transcriptional regulator
MSFLDFLYRRTTAGQVVLQRDIEQEFQIKRSTATQVLQTMETKGLITRQSAAQDARQKEVRLTAAAQDQVQLVRDYIEASDTKITAGYSAAEVRVITHFLQHIAELNKEENFD